MSVPLALVALPLAPYDEFDEDCDCCSAWRNCSRSFAVLLSVEGLPVGTVDDVDKSEEPSSDGGGPGGGPPAPPGPPDPLAKAD